jgi:hypothetical protein
MQKLKYRKLNKLLKNNSLIASSITETLYALRHMELFVNEQLPVGLREHVKPLNISGFTLVLMVSTPAWKSKLRFQLPALEKQLQQKTGNQLRQISVKIVPEKQHEGNTSGKKIERSSLSLSSQSVIKGLADSLDDSRLKSSLLRLSQQNPR